MNGRGTTEARWAQCRDRRKHQGTSADDRQPYPPQRSV